MTPYFSHILWLYCLLLPLTNRAQSATKAPAIVTAGVVQEQATGASIMDATIQLHEGERLVTQQKSNEKGQFQLPLVFDHDVFTAQRNRLNPGHPTVDKNPVVSWP